MRRSVTPWSACLLVLLAIASCSNSSGLELPGSDQTKQSVSGRRPQVPVTPIAEIHQQSAPFPQPLNLTGTVGKQVPLLGRYAYKLSDETGSIWVLTGDPAPKTGDEVLIQGIVRFQKVEGAGETLTERYVEQQAQLFRRSASQ